MNKYLYFLFWVFSVFSVFGLDSKFWWWVSSGLVQELVLQVVGALNSPSSRKKQMLGFRGIYSRERDRVRCWRRPYVPMLEQQNIPKKVTGEMPIRASSRQVRNYGHVHVGKKGDNDTIENSEH